MPDPRSPDHRGEGLLGYARGKAAGVKLSFTLNGEEVVTSADAGVLLVDLIRDLGLTGTKEACGVGVCGLCTVLV
ncbi:MAG TPA: 2Fe-2S iron-sulfur cluster-binding protein, partial [Trebonia sp.]|nr:2Fe-2S iron-sulfur cluster-binding protein [Trebonia sp.]